MSKNKVNTKVLSGFVELLPEQQKFFNYIKDEVRASYEKFGYFSIDTPTIERSEVLFAKAGGETEKQIYRFTKGDNDLSLRFDLTIPFARYVADHYNDLVFPFKRYQIGKVYRGERAQKGRYREFYQADIDIVAENNLSIMYDVDIISTIFSTINNFHFLFVLGLGFATIKISNRKIWEGFFEEFGITGDKKASIMGIIDKKAKMTAEDFNTELSEVVGDEKITSLILKLFEVEYMGKIGISIPDKYHADFTFINKNEKMKEGISELETVISTLKAGYPDSADTFTLDLSIVRGLDYYTGTVFETYLDDYPDFGSIASGGRYENLCDNYTDKKICGVGGSIGLSRLFIPLIESMKIKEDIFLNVLILPQNEACYKKAFVTELNLLSFFKEEQIIRNISAIYEDKKFKKLMEYANKLQTLLVIIIGDDELANNTLTLKNMISGEQSTQSLEATKEILKNTLKK